MTNSELIEYLGMFDGNADVSIIIANPKGRKVYDKKNVFMITDAGQTVICIELGEPRDMDEEEVRACEEDESAGDSI